MPEKNKIFPFSLLVICALWTIYHGAFLHLNDILKVADSFAYLQMSHHLGEFSQKWLGNGWFGFVYSLPITLVNSFIWNDFLSAKIVNLILFCISAILLFHISKKVLSERYSLLVVILFFLSPTLLHFNIHVLSENIYIPLFLGLFLLVHKFVENNLQWNQKKSITSVIAIWCCIWLMYLTRAEAFIYMGSIGLLALWLLVKQKLSLRSFFWLGSIFFISFFIFISPYLIHLHSMTGQWGLTNKWASNLRQAELRWVEKMDDAGFEKAVAELTPDNTQLIAGFAWGMEYIKPKIEGSLGSFIQKDPSWFIERKWKNQLKLFTRNIPEIFLWKAPKLYFSEDKRFSHIPFLVFSIFPLLVLVFWSIQLFRKEKVFSSISMSFFLPALIFFTLFFTLNRYFLIFLPLMLVAFIYGIQELWSIFSQKKMLQNVRYILAANYILVLLLSTLVYYNIESPKDEYYALKKQAGEWLSFHVMKEESFWKEETITWIRISDSLSFANERKKLSSKSIENLKIMERFPIVTYYSGSKYRYITPYTDDIQDIFEYAQHNNLDILVVDSMDFKTYRPKLEKYLEKTPNWFKKLKEFTNKKWQKVILYTRSK